MLRLENIHCVIRRKRVVFQAGCFQIAKMLLKHEEGNISLSGNA